MFALPSEQMADAPMVPVASVHPQRRRSTSYVRRCCAVRADNESVPRWPGMPRLYATLFGILCLTEVIVVVREGYAIVAVVWRECRDALHAVYVSCGGGVQIQQRRGGKARAPWVPDSCPLPLEKMSLRI